MRTILGWFFLLLFVAGPLAPGDAFAMTVTGTIRIGSSGGPALSGVAMTIVADDTGPSGGSGSCTTNPTNASGVYVCNFTNNKGFTLTPSKLTYSFSPVSRHYDTNAALTGEDYVATSTATTTAATTTTTAGATTTTTAGATTTTSTASTTTSTTATTTGGTTTTTPIGYGGTGDTDIYIENTSPSVSTMPMVMFSLDFRPNLGSTACNGGECDFLVPDYLTAGVHTPFEVMRAVLKKVIAPLSGVRVGFMINHDNTCTGAAPNSGPTPSSGQCSNGGYIRMGFKPFYTDDSNGAKAAFNQALADLGEPGGSVSHSYQGKELFFEFFRYLTGQAWYNAHNGWTDFGTSSTYNLNSSNDYSPANVSLPRSWDSSIESGASYITPLTEDAACTKIFTINLMFDVSNQEDDSDSAITASQATGGMTGINLAGANNNFATVIGWLHDNDIANGLYGTAPLIDGVQNVTSFFLIPPPKETQPKPTSYATSGGTTAAYPLNLDASLYNNLVNIFNQILSVSTTFVSASVPVNVFNRTQVMDSVYIAIFEADKDGKPLWPGNIKKLKLVTDINGITTLVDAANVAAVALDGRIKDDALTLWTDPTGQDVTTADATVGEVAGKDGRSVKRGGAGQKIPGFLAPKTISYSNYFGPRKLYTEPTIDSITGNYTSTTLRDWDTSLSVSYASEIQTALGVADWAQATTLLNFSRGDLDGSSSTTADMRTWLLGDPLHSRVMPVNYGARSGFTNPLYPDMRLLMGSNDGYMHMFQDTDSGGTQLGTEKWGFIPLAVAGQISRLKSNTAGYPKHPHTVDGPAVVYMNDANSNGTIDGSDVVYTYFGLRRGGRNYYALNVTDPDLPTMLWAAKQSVGTDFTELGLTYSTPRVKKISYDGIVDQPVLIFGGGYDANKDVNILPGTNDTMGNAIYIVDAVSGALIWKAVGPRPPAVVTSVNPTVYYHADMTNSIPSEVSTLDSNGDGRVDRIYVGDTGGDVWRVDMKGTDRSKWVVNRILTLGRNQPGLTAAEQANEDRRFFHRPDVVRFRDDSGYYDAVILGSGDREDPLDKNSSTYRVVNWIYMFKDRSTDSITIDSTQPTTVTHSLLADLTDDCLQNDSCISPPDLTYGWRIQMERNGEKVLSSPLTVSGVIYVSSYIPPGGVDAATCGPSEGSGVLYTISLADATAPKPVDQTTGETIEGRSLTKTDRESPLASGGIPSDVVALPPDRILRPDLTVQKISQKSFWKTYWYQSNE